MPRNRVGRFTKKGKVMASVTHEKRKLANGEFRYKATIRTKKDGVIIHRESKTFTKKELAVQWGKIRLHAIEQNGDFELKFGEFLTIEPQTYLILENKKSNYNIALYILEGDFLLDELYTYPEKYKGKTIFANHENINMGGVMRMVYRGGILIEN